MSCEHFWGEARRQFMPPVAHEYSARAALYGETLVQLECVKCGLPAVVVLLGDWVPVTAEVVE